MTYNPDTQIDTITTQLRQREADSATISANARNAQRVKYVVFRLAEEWYGIPAPQVRSISRTPPVTRLPGATAHILGVVNLSTTAITPVIDIRPALGLRPRPEMPQSADLRLVVLSASVDERSDVPGETSVGTRTTLVAAVVADQVSEVKEVPVTQIEPPLLTLEPARAAMISGVTRIGDRTVTLLDPVAILSRFRL